MHLFDIRADQEIKSYSKQSIICGASSLDFSKSGRDGDQRVGGQGEGKERLGVIDVKTGGSG